MSDRLVDGPQDDFRKVVSRHGHAFQYAVIRRADLLCGTGRSQWLFNAAEVPVEVQGHGTRIDLVLERRSWSGLSDLLIAECKRANPAHANWCFAKAPYIRRGSGLPPIILERVCRTEDGVEAGPHFVGHGRDIYGLAYEVRTDAKGDGAPGRGAIEEASSQLMKGLSGIVELLARQPNILPSQGGLTIVPVIFTTATVWVTNVDMAEAEVSNGAMPEGELLPAPRGWLWYRYHISPGIAHTQKQRGSTTELGDFVEHRFARCIAVVSPLGIDDFMSAESW